MAKRIPSKVRKAGQVLNDPKSTVKQKEEAAKILNEHQNKP